MDFKIIRKLIELLESSQLSELSVEEEGVKISLKKTAGSPEVKISHQPIPAQPVPALDARKAAETTEAQKTAAEPYQGLTPIISPIVGTFYRAASPEAASYVEEGDSIKKGQVVCIIEAMKMFNEIESEVNGQVVKILANNGETAEYGQVLMLVDESAA